MPVIRYPFWVAQAGEQERALLLEVLATDFLNDGEYTRRFERKLATLLDCRHAVAVTSGTAAIFLALAGLGIGHGDEVLVPDVTFIATANAVTMTGATPVLVDVEPLTLSIDPEAMHRAITPRTRAVVPVHVSGRPADMDAICQIAQRHDLQVIEDAAEALTSRFAGRCLGTIGRAGCFSFSPNKIVGTGQGGAVVTNDDALHERLVQLKDQGRSARGTGGADTHVGIGYNFKLTNMQAAVGLAQLERLPARIERIKQTWRQYAQRLDGLDGVRVGQFRLEDGQFPQWVDAMVDRRDELDAFLLERGAQCRRFWFPLHTQAPYRRPDADFPVSTRLVPRSIWLPSAFTSTDDDVSAVCDLILEFAGRRESPASRRLNVAGA